jgi:hypothetical protein
MRDRCSHAIGAVPGDSRPAAAQRLIGARRIRHSGPRPPPLWCGTARALATLLVETLRSSAAVVCEVCKFADLSTGLWAGVVTSALLQQNCNWHIG